MRWVTKSISFEGDVFDEMEKLTPPRMSRSQFVGIALKEFVQKVKANGGNITVVAENAALYSYNFNQTTNNSPTNSKRKRRKSNGQAQK